MDILSIKFRYFEKLKLWHDYLSPDSIYETQKKGFWSHEKLILLWAYTGLHGHLYTGLSNSRLLQIYNLDHGGNDIREDKDQKNEFRKLKEKVIKKYHKEMNKLKEDMIKNSVGTGKINYIMGNLVIKGFMDEIKESKDDTKGYPTKIQINAKGLLLGEILYENFCNPNIFRKNYWKYKQGIGLIRSLITVASISIFLILVNQIAELVKWFFQ